MQTPASDELPFDPEWLATNSSLPDTQIHEVQSHIKRIASRIASLDADIARLQKPRQALASLLYSLKAAVSPLRSLPPELLSEIFLHCLPSSAEPYSFDPSETPNLLAQICTRWRAVALGLQPLWAAMCLDLDDLPDLRLVALWLERSGTHSLTLRIAAGDEYCTLEQATAVAQMLELLAPHAPRIRHVAVRVPVPRLQPLAVFSGRLPALFSLEIESTQNDAGGGDEFSFPSAFEDLPALRELRLPGPLFSDEMKLRWSQLTSFHAAVCSYRDWFFVLAECPRLKCFKIDSGEYWEEEETPDGYWHTTHATLEALHIDYADDLFVASIFTKSTLPGLLHLTTRDAGLYVPPSFAPFVTRSGCALQTLHIGSSFLSASRAHRVSGAHFLDALDALPGLVELSMKGGQGVDYPDLLGMALTWGAGGHRLPSLRFLDLYVDNPYTRRRCQLLPLALMLGTRWEASRGGEPSGTSPAWLEDVTLHFSAHRAPAVDEKYLDDLCRIGMPLRILRDARDDANDDGI
ncbi:hypothetical protein PLICRDRAFT_361699 [Plicaturopsis crispa FD-325 SS-3]|uniref:Unplaced genomic scaffold PLICRscaffold_18, whole genome shotgun sequence n=1 Tax=Plicaturopsis crispa FD-325 SS-3 TaxID=944288 RepID=A0A0C9SR48_PLICR|nr:hypothetical protein PLICRDRAFT_361699 [Plicaturopsis crispa FD-325 SS-3]